MFDALKLLLPALVPSWRFFGNVGPSPRIEFTLLRTAQDRSDDWQEFRPRPARVSIGSMLARLFWNPRWNETLFVVACTERLLENPTDHSLREIRRRIARDIVQSGLDVRLTPYLQFRLISITREGETLQSGVDFTSEVHPIAEAGAP